MSNWLNKKMGTNWGATRWGIVTGGFAFSCVLIVFISILFATTTTWNFSTPSDYTYDADVIEVTGGVARLRKDFTKTWNDQTTFNAGVYNNTGWEVTVGDPVGVELLASGTDTLTLGSPIVGSGSYTSDAIQARVSSTKWNTMN